MFKAGRDGGIDGRFFTASGTVEVIQCKHYIKSGFTSLYQELSNSELAKVQKLNLKKYYLVTSLGLRPENKAKVRDLFSLYMPNDDYVIWQEHLNIYR